MKLIETGRRPNFSAPLRLCPRIIVFRPFVEQLPKLDVAGSTPVARSLVTVRRSERFPRDLEKEQREVQSERLDFHRPSPGYVFATPLTALLIATALSVTTHCARSVP